jgi:hypothetical protein
MSTKEQARGRGGARTSPRTAAWIAWSLWGLSSVLTALSLVLLVLNRSHRDVPIFAYWVEYAWGAVVFSTVGAVIASRRPENRIGWIFCVAGLVGGVHHFGAEYAIYASLAVTGSIPGAASLAWIASWTWVPYIGLLLSLGLLFPTGRLPTRRWRWYAVLVVAVCLVGAVLVALSPGPISGLGSVENPAGIEGLGAIGGVRADYLVQAALGALALATAFSMFRRLLGARGEERQQLKWFAYAAAVLACGVVLAYTVAPLIAVSWVSLVGFVLVMVGTLGVPIAVGIAILRHHLYDIDIIINRTLVYGTLTATLVAVYFGGIVLLQGVGSLVLQVPFRVLTGQETQLATVAATLAIAALFNPLRRRIQAFIDRRFYRRKYDAAKTLQAFSAKLKDETDLNALSDDLVGVVRETMQPAHVSLWLRPDAGSKESRGEDS